MKRNENVDKLIQEINEIDKTISQNKIEIGRKFISIRDELKKKKSWIKYITDNTLYTRMTVNNYVRVIEEILNVKSIIHLESLDHTKLVILLSLSQELRENFISNNDLENMSCSQIKKEIKKINDEINPPKEKDTKGGKFDNVFNEDNIGELTDEEKEEINKQITLHSKNRYPKEEEEYRKKYIKILSKNFHPDVGGTNEDMHIILKIKEEWGV